MEEGSAVFCGHRPLGYVANGVPLVTRYITRRKEHLIVTASGKTFQTWGSNKLGLLSVSKVHPLDLTALSCDSFLVFAAAGPLVYAWRRGDELQRVYRGHTATVHLLLPFGPNLLSVDTEGVLKVWDIKSGAEVLELTFTPSRSRVSALCHPSTYLDKVVVGTGQGHLQLWNLKSTKLVYTFPGWGAGVTVLQQAPAIDVLAVGLQSGEVYLHNLKYDETIVKFRQDWGPVTGVAFRTDDSPMMITGSPPGHLAVWDLEGRKLQLQLRAAHQGSVTGLACLPGEPIMVTSSPDNSIKQWIFDMTDGGARELRKREGHSAPPSRVRYYGGAGESLVSAGQDSSLRVFSTVADILHRSLGHASFNRKVSKKHKVSEDPARMPPIVEFTCEAARDREWDNIAAIHRGQGLATTWSFGDGKMGELKLLHERFKETPELRAASATCLALSVCGNFVVIGYSSGHVDRFNIQSGIHRGSYQIKDRPAHKNPLRGVATDGLNQRLVTADSRGVAKVWRLKAATLLGKVELGSDLSAMKLQRESGLVGLAMEDFTILVLDIDTRKVVRRLPGHSASITDFAFSADSRWLVSVSLDSTMRVWDLPTGHCLDYVLFDRPATSCDLSPSSSSLATSHVGDLGIYLWTNKTLYSPTTLAPVREGAEPRALHLPSRLLVEKSEVEEQEAMEVEVKEEEEFASPDQISSQLITLANLPGSRWLNLLSLDVIKAKNKPKAAPKKPKAAPFFLPTIPGLATTFDLSAVAGEGEERAPAVALTSFTAFGKALSQADSPLDYRAMLEQLLTLGPSALDLEVRCLAPEGGGTLSLMLQFLKMIRAGLEGNGSFEAVQAYLGLFLRVHGEAVAEEEELVEEVAALGEVQGRQWSALQASLDSCLALTTFFKSSFL